MKNLDFIFAKDSFPLYFHVVDDKIYLYDDIPENIRLTPDQVYLHQHSSYLCDIQISGRPTTIHAGDRHIGSSESNYLKYVSHQITYQAETNTLIIIQSDDLIKVTSYYIEYRKSKTVRCYVEVENISSQVIDLEYVSSFCKYDAIRYFAYDHTEVMIPHNAWYMECQWKRYLLDDLGIIAPNMIKSFKKFCIANTGAWSSKSYLPMVMLHDKNEGDYNLFQIESNGSWTYEIGDYLQNASIHLSGPSLEENGWCKSLKSQEVFTSVKVSITKANSLEEVFKNITLYRREIINITNTDDQFSIIFNEYMHASWNDPNAESAKALAPIAKKMGADYYVIDCGWHDEEANPFYHVGKWKESHKKYPDGLKKTLDYIKSLGLKVGLWLEPEVVGCLGDAYKIYSNQAFFKRNNKILKISNRYQLNFANAEVYQHMLDLIDRLVNDYQIDYFKFDYNIDPGVGYQGESKWCGTGLLEHNRKYHDFVSEIKKKYPNIKIESCASGGNRLDYYTLDNVDLCSTSDQDNYALYPYICANILSAVLPEQAGIWSYPVDSRMEINQIDDEIIIMNMINSFIGRIHLASKIYLLDQQKQNLIYEAISLYKKYSPLRKESYPYFPIGLASFNNPHLAFGFRNDSIGILCVYNMHGIQPIIIKLTGVKSIKYIYPNKDITYSFDDEVLTIIPERELIARLFEVTFK